MSFKEVLEKIPFLNRIDNVLVCEADFLGLRAAVMHKKGQMLSVTHQAHAESAELTVAVSELVEQARKQGWNGKHAVLLNPAVVFGLLELTIPADNKLSMQQIAESVRWELEPLMTQHQRLLSIGQILLLNGFIKPEQLEDILNQQETANQSKNRDVFYKNFGGLALELGFVKQTQLDQCLSRQAWFASADEEVQCGWRTQALPSESDADRHPWLVAGMNKSLLRQWQAAFSQQEVKLVACYPLTGSALPALSKLQSTDKNKNVKSLQHELVFELHTGLLTGSHLSNGQVLQMQSMQNDANTTLSNISDIYHGFGIEDLDQISLIDSLSKTERDATQLVADLSNVIAQPIHIYPKPTNEINLGMYGAAQHFMQLKTAENMVAVSVEDPAPPLLQRFEIRAVLAGLVLMGLLGVAEASLLVQKYMIHSEMESMAPEVKKVGEAISIIQRQVDEVAKYKKEIKEKSAEETKLQDILDLLSVDLPKRNESLMQFLKGLNLTVSEDVVIDGISEDTYSGFSITGWSINEQSAQEFVRRFQVAVHPLGYKLKNITVNQQTGRLGLLGYAINFSATTLDEDIWSDIKQGKRPVLSGSARGQK